MLLVAPRRPNDKAIDEATASIVEAFKVTYGGDQEDDVPPAGAKRSAGGVSNQCFLSRHSDITSRVDRSCVPKSPHISPNNTENITPLPNIGVRLSKYHPRKIG